MRFHEQTVIRIHLDGPKPECIWCVGVTILYRNHIQVHFTAFFK